MLWTMVISLYNILTLHGILLCGAESVLNLFVKQKLHDLMFMN